MLYDENRQNEADTRLDQWIGAPIAMEELRRTILRHACHCYPRNDWRWPCNRHVVSDDDVLAAVNHIKSLRGWWFNKTTKDAAFQTSLYEQGKAIYKREAPDRHDYQI